MGVCALLFMGSTAKSCIFRDAYLGIPSASQRVEHTQVAMNDRRKSRRTRVKVPVFLRATGPWAGGSITNLSITGCCITFRDAWIDVPHLEALMALPTAPPRTIRTEGRVSLKANRTCGIEFLTLTLPDYQTLSTYITGILTD